MLKKLRKTLGGKKQPLELFDRYVSTTPSYQNAIDVVPGWSSSLPARFGVKAGELATYADPRISWAIEQFGSLQDRDVLELGPLEAGHTYMLEQAGARVDAVEANQLAFLRCLITKEILGLRRSRFWLGDFMRWLEDVDLSYDFIVASGVLYHLADPLRLIELIAQRTSAVYIWTHLVWEGHMMPDNIRRQIFAPEIEEHEFHGVTVRAYRRTYLDAHVDPAFCGGIRDEHRWLNREDVFKALNAVGFREIRTAHDEPGHRFGPSLSIFARK
ncbi:MAG TPA: class I SAM-dependent methyltransferase [Methylocystis sp.]|nr:class I SAM-dependent methyltransferase [Methylocystis sp.]